MSDQLLRTRLGEWSPSGKWDLQSSAGAEIAQESYRRTDSSKMPLICCGFASDKPEEVSVRGHLDIGRTVIDVSYFRAIKPVCQMALHPYVDKLPRAPITREESQKIIKIRFEAAETQAVEFLGTFSSRTASIILR